MHRFRRGANAGIAVFALAATLAAGAAVPAAGAVTRSDAGRSDAARTRLDGVWRTDGYGAVLQIEHGRLRTWQTTSVSCLPDPETATAVGRPGADGSVRFEQDDASGLTVRPEGPGRARLGYDGSVGHLELRRIGALPPRCGEEAPDDPRAVFDVFWRTYAENYPFFAAHGVDWDAQRDRYRPRVTGRTTPEQLFSVLREMIEPLRDAHTSLVMDEKHRYHGSRPGTPTDFKDFKERVAAALARELPPVRTWARGHVAYAELPDRIGYLRIDGFDGYSDEPGYAAEEAELDRALDVVFSAAHTKGPERMRGLVLDVRLNGGGDDALALRIASRLTDRPYLAYAKRARNDPDDPARFTRPQPVMVHPAKSPRFTGPVAELTGITSVSAAETFTQALMGRAPHVTRVGENTQGAFSDTLDRVLPNGWRFSLPNEQFTTAPDSDRGFDVTGIPPDVRTPVFTDSELEHGPDSALNRAHDLLTGRAPR
ncbi:S41 family peptidase [Streptomyces sp. NPDC050617]|uniref:S41 family peptidase n=1 Tax=Streptomyces sp. NPDC050617 TaxID=3154628 RepID=UPI00343F4F7F